MSVPKKTFSLNRSSALQFFQRWGQSLFPLFYLILVLIGMLFEYYYYRYFDINIFAYSDILDFLLAPAKDLTIIIFTIFSIGLSFLFLQLDIWMESRSSRFYNALHFGLVKRSWFRTYRTISFALITLFYCILSASIYGKAHAKAVHLKPRVEVYFQNQNEKPDILNAILVGKNKDYLFLLDDESIIRIIPTISQVKELRFTKKFEKPD